MQQPNHRGAMHPFFRFVVEPTFDGLTLSQVLRRLRFSRKLLGLLHREGRCTRDGRDITLQAIVHSGERIELHLPLKRASSLTPERIPLVVLAEDDHWLVIDKPAGLLVHPSGPIQTGTLANGVAYHLLRQGEPYWGAPVTRLDRLTSGLVLFAKHPHAQHACTQAIHAGTLRRTYLAVVAGWIDEDAGTITAPIGRVPGSLTRRTIVPEGEGQSAITHFRVLHRFTPPHVGIGPATLVQVTLQTGRTHQIRVHMAHRGHPLFGDSLYGIPLPGVCDRQALHAWRLTAPHPVEKRTDTWLSPLPADIRRLLPPHLHESPEASNE